MRKRQAKKCVKHELQTWKQGWRISDAPLKYNKRLLRRYNEGIAHTRESAQIQEKRG